MMKKIAIVFILIFVFSGFMYSTEVTLGLGWRISHSGFVSGECSLPLFSTETYEKGMEKETYIREFTLSRDVNFFLRRAFFVFGMEFFLYKKKISLGFELNVGFIKRDMNILSTAIFEYEDKEPSVSAHERQDSTIIIPANYFVIVRYKFDSVKESLGWLRPYIGAGGGLNTAVFLEGVDALGENGRDIEEESWEFSGAFLAMCGTDILLSKDYGLFLELRYIHPLGGGRNHREQASLAVGFKFI